MSKTTDTTLITAREAAKMLCTTENTLGYWRCTKTVSIPFVKIGKAVRYRKRDLEKFIQDNLRSE